MTLLQLRWKPETGWENADAGFAAKTNLVLVFGDHPYFNDPDCFIELRSLFQKAIIFGCSSAGNILDISVTDHDIVATAVIFERGSVELAVEDLDESLGLEAQAAGLMRKLDQGGLRHVFVLSDGLKINGSALAKGLHGAGGSRIPVTGGLAGDGTRFEETWVMADAPAHQGRIAALGFYGAFNIKSGCCAGWEEFGAERLVTRSSGNVVREIDGQPALALYKKYLGAQASQLPASGLRFPLSVRAHKDTEPTIRTLLAVDESMQSLTFAGDVPEGNLCRLMKTNFDALIDSAETAAQNASFGIQPAAALCLSVSCVGRRLFLGLLTEEEIEAIREKLGAGTVITGFYSYGELAPFGESQECQLHNQTMTLTTLHE